MVEHNLAKVGVAGSTPVSRSVNSGSQAKAGSLFLWWGPVRTAPGGHPVEGGVRETPEGRSTGQDLNDRDMHHASASDSIPLVVSVMAGSCIQEVRILA